MLAKVINVAIGLSLCRDHKRYLDVSFTSEQMKRRATAEVDIGYSFDDVIIKRERYAT